MKELGRLTTTGFQGFNRALTRRELLIGAAALIGSSGCAMLPKFGEESVDTSDLLLFNSKGLPYQIYYPSMWRTSNSSAQNIYGSPVDSFLGEQTGGYQTRVDITERNLGKKGVSLDSFESTIKSEINDTIDKIRKGGGGVLTKGTRPSFKIAGHDVSMLSARIPRSASNMEMDLNAAIFVDQNTGWQIMLTTDPSVTQKELTRFNKMIKTFKFTV